MDGAAAQRSMRLLAMIRGILAVVVDILVPAHGIDIIATDPGCFGESGTSNCSARLLVEDELANDRMTLHAESAT